MAEEEYDFIFKVLLLGNSDVGKSSMLLRFVDSVWNDAFTPTIGVDFKVKTLEINNKRVKMQIWDTAGQERFRTVVSTYFRGAHGILLLYDVTNKDSFKNLENWLIEIEKNSNQKVLKILIGNKCDLTEDREITTEEGQTFANRNGMEFMETSAKMNTNVSEAFTTLGKLMIEFNSKTNTNQGQKSGEVKTLKSNSGKDLNTKKKCC
jgi:Ras-related protein Rab-1A